ncbi:MAG: hypothetical protein J7K85_08735 [Anaerolineaceae bacterium]|nr:hypothetical protein [Anaerolineaceae bacterium]
MDRSEFHERILLFLHDSDSTRYDEDLLDSALRQSLNHFSLAVPMINRTELMVAADGYEYSLNTLTSLTQVLAIWYPWCDGDLPVKPLREWYLYWQNGTPVLRLQEKMFEEGTSMKLFYAACHTISGLDGAESTTLPEVSEETLALGAAGKAALIRASHLVESHGSPASDRDQLFQLGQLWWEGFKARLSEFKRMAPLPISHFDEYSWEMET